jgi:hypothetical protein
MTNKAEKKKTMNEIWISEEEYISLCQKHECNYDLVNQTELLKEFLTRSGWSDSLCELRDHLDGTGQHLYRPLELSEEDEKFIMARRERLMAQRKAAFIRERDRQRK